MEPADINAPSVGERVLRRSESSSSDCGGDFGIQLTNDEAVMAKRYAVDAGYWHDSFIGCFARPPERKAPEINRGYWARVAAVRKLLNLFLETAGPSGQIVNLGGGFDTLYWCLCESGTQFKTVVEVDFPAVTSKKLSLIQKQKKLSEHIKGMAVDHSHVEMHSEKYHLVGADLRSTKEVRAKLLESGVQFDLPTCFLCECVLIYMTSEQSANLLTFLASAFPTSCFINYEQVNMDDRFGQVMQNNLQNRGVLLAGVNPCHDLESQRQRFIDCGWSKVKDWNMNQVYQLLPLPERNRIEHLEFLDEVELMTQLLQHYCIVVAYRDAKKLGLERATL